MPEEQKKILIVEDAVPLARALREALEGVGFIVAVAGDGEHGLELARSEKPNLILLDILLPKKDGLWLLKELRTTDEGKKIPVMMLTNLSDTKNVNTALQYGAYDYMVKSDWKINDIVESIQKKLYHTV